METEITCYFCYEIFEVYLDLIEGSDTVIVDCDVCCNPNLIRYQISNNSISVIDINSGNE